MTNEQIMEELPLNYRGEQLTLLVRDPHVLFAFWQSESNDDRLQLYLSDPAGTPRQLIDEFSLDGADRRYIPVPLAGRHYVGRIVRAGRPPLESNIVMTPPDRPSHVEDPYWKPIDSIEQWLQPHPAGMTSFR